MSTRLKSIELPFDRGVHVPDHGGEGIHEISDASGKVIASLNPLEEIEDQADVEAVAGFLCQACNAHDDLLVVCEAIAESFDENGEFQYHAAGNSISELVRMARTAVAKAKMSDRPRLT